MEKKYTEMEFDQGSISPNFVRQAKIRRHTASGKIGAIQFHQHFFTENLPKTFAKFVRRSPNLCAIRQTPFTEKSFSSWARKQMLMKSTPGGNNDHLEFLYVK